MNIAELLKGRDCACGKHHACAIKHVIVEEGAISKIGEIVADYQHILLVADQNTYGVCGDAVRAELGAKCADAVIFQTEGYLVPNEEAIAEVDRHLTPEIDLIMGIGSGVIQDLCKYTSFMAKLPYHVVATAPSMDGYASVGAAMILGNMKVTVSAHVPEAIIADVNVIKDAPMDLIQSGYGDILGKFSCLNDWKLGHVINDEYICDYVYNLTFEMLNKTKDLGAKLQARDGDAIKTLMEALVGVGIAMAYVGNSRPASGSEHHLSHFFEVIGLLKNEPYFLHGIDVVYSAVYTQKLRERILTLNAPIKGYQPTREEYEQTIREVYYGAAEGVIALQNKLGWYDINRYPAYAERWARIKETLAEVPSSEELAAYVRSVGLDIKDFEEQYGEEKISNALWFAKDLKDRFSVLWLYFDLFYQK
ncbi:MAG: sn-glycerol-1-phosphate dehydrogenase [Clostridia bacterium]|nr:sn-glycerol-1-phosphate dehydrogenase [Clostridia bacterium]